MDLQSPDAAQALALAQNLFTQMLEDSPPALAYLAGTPVRRPVPVELRRTAGLGYAADGYSYVLAGWGIPAAMQEHLGLIDAAGGEVYRDRVTFPWLNATGTRVTGMGGRAIVEGRRPKYVNTPTVAWFDKGHAVWGYTQAARAMHGAEYAIVLEGIFDAVALWEMGWTNAVATVGAKITLDQLLAVARLVPTSW